MKEVTEKVTQMLEYMATTRQPNVVAEITHPRHRVGFRVRIDLIPTELTETPDGPTDENSKDLSRFND
jgi:hypothetical protein